MILLGVNIDHIATIRQARRTVEPDPVHAAVLAELGGANQITVHLREDRRHIQDRDVRILKEILRVRLNLELGLNEEIVGIALDIKPQQVCIVPETREEITTEGGLDVAADLSRVKEHIARFHEAGIEVSTFIDPTPRQVQASIEAGADAVELHTGRYANAAPGPEVEAALNDIVMASQPFLWEDERFDPLTPLIRVNLGHGLTYQNTARLLHTILPNPLVYELNIGHTIVARATMVGMEQAVREMKSIIEKAESAATLTVLQFGVEQIMETIDELDDDDLDDDDVEEEVDEDTDTDRPPL